MGITCKHNWWAYSVSFPPYSTGNHQINLQCRKCLMKGSVEEFTEKEWRRAFGVSTDGFRWTGSQNIHTGVVMSDEITTFYEPPWAILWRWLCSGLRRA